jgi:ATP:cob(I)alamin adenosyltransferase
MLTRRPLELMIGRGLIMRAVRIYTKTGDRGTSGLFSGERRTKTHSVFRALGDTDELNANIGLVRRKQACEHLQTLIPGAAEQLKQIQCRLIDVGTHLATPKQTDDADKLQTAEFPEDHTLQLEHWIDFYTDSLPPLRNFILPSGGLASAQLHVTRAVCRRAERSIVELMEAGDVDNSVVKYVNRLSDLLFTLARAAAQAAGQEEVKYSKSSQGQAS